MNYGKKVNPRRKPTPSKTIFFICQAPRKKYPIDDEQNYYTIFRYLLVLFFNTIMHITSFRLIVYTFFEVYTMPNILELVGSRIREIRKTKSLSQEQLGELSGFHFSYIGGLERGERNISLVNLAKIAEALEVNIHELLNFEPKLSEEKLSSIDEIVKLLNTREQRQIAMAKNILTEIFRTFR